MNQSDIIPNNSMEISPVTLPMTKEFKLLTDFMITTQCIFISKMLKKIKKKRENNYDNIF